jgi:hypothetical protein
MIGNDRWSLGIAKNAEDKKTKRVKRSHLAVVGWFNGIGNSTHSYMQI